MNKINYQKWLDNLIKENIENNITPSLLLHACCAPCSSYVLEYLSQYFNIIVYFYNPNISTSDEYNHRAKELKRLVSEMNFKNPVKVIISDYNPDEFHFAAKGLEDCRECGERCFKCYELRLRKTAMLAKDKKIDYFTTTLSISPLKNADKLNEIGSNLESELEIRYLHSDFKKREGYKRSIELSKNYNLYRQNFCGCIYSKK